ncbi:helix-turn-helix domain-containing protein [Paraliobacillus ryukyuensis]|uniref:helix-turn-helix domain-containing protein n=1 Tax=Paraliobacillus ryukyuensis TaxID=200904 RepID=UPI0009A5E544|nr:helix-turn-helix transcriptional regulator [Paraliobacillus ryukyuensis]
MNFIIAENLKLIRSTNGYSLSLVSEGTGITKSTLSRIENGKSPITVDHLDSLTSFYNIDIKLLFIKIKNENKREYINLLEKIKRTPIENVSIEMLRKFV